MIITILAPSKGMSTEKPSWATSCAPLFCHQTAELSSALKTLPANEIKTLMKVSDTIAETTADRFRALGCDTPITPALFAYRGDAYLSLDANTLDEEAIQWADNRLRILSGLYGALSPLTGIQPYRLEMGLSFPGFGVLSTWWKKTLTAHMQELAGDDGIIINLASAEYAKAIDKKLFKGRFVEVAFKEQVGDKQKAIAIHAKRARGAMARWILENRTETVENLKEFQETGYRFDEAGSSETSLLFIREV